MKAATNTISAIGATMKSALVLPVWLMMTTFSSYSQAFVDFASPQPPVARQIPKVDMVHGDRRVDNYFWLREKSNPEVAAYLDAENAYTDAVMKPTVGLEETLCKEMVGHTRENRILGRRRVSANGITELKGAAGRTPGQTRAPSANRRDRGRP